MADFAYSTETTINAEPKAVFDIVSDLSLHAELAGSGELNKATQRPAGPVGTGTHLDAEETVKLGDGSGMDVTAESVVVVNGPARGSRHAPRAQGNTARPAFVNTRRP